VTEIMITIKEAATWVVIGILVTVYFLGLMRQIFRQYFEEKEQFLKRKETK